MKINVFAKSKLSDACMKTIKTVNYMIVNACYSNNGGLHRREIVQRG